MGTNVLKIGSNMILEAGGVITIFDAKGVVQGENWLTNSLLGVFVETSPAPVSPDIEDCIGNDFEAGNGKKIHHIKVSPNTAVRLFLEGKLSGDDIKRADVSSDILIIFRDIPFKTPGGDCAFNLHVDPHLSHAFATIDVDGNVV